MASRLNRLIRIIRFISGGGYPSVSDLCCILQVKERTLFGDLKELKEDLGVNIQYDRLKNGYYMSAEEARIQFSNLTEESALLLLAAVDLLGQFAGHELADSLRDVFRDEISICFKQSGYSAKRISSLLKAEPLPGRRLEKELFLALCRACAKEEALCVTLKQSKSFFQEIGLELATESSAQKVQLRIVPLHLSYGKNSWRLAFRNYADGLQVHELDIGSIIALE